MQTYELYLASTTLLAGAGAIFGVYKMNGLMRFAAFLRVHQTVFLTLGTAVLCLGFILSLVFAYLFPESVVYQIEELQADFPKLGFVGYTRECLLSVGLGAISIAEV